MARLVLGFDHQHLNISAQTPEVLDVQRHNRCRPNLQGALRDQRVVNHATGQLQSGRHK
jgi:hypothetical protein